MDRRSFLQTGLAGVAAGLTLGVGNPLLASDDTKRRPIALQLYSVRDLAQKDFAATLQTIAKIGYRGVEFAGVYGHAAPEIKKMLNDAGLAAVGAHLAVGDLLGDHFNETIEYYKNGLDCSRLIVAGGLGEVLRGDAGNRFTAYLFDELADKAAVFGCSIGFHAHAGDFCDMGNGDTAWDLFFKRTQRMVIAEMDVGNALDSGADPYAAIEKAAGRGKLIHLKASGPRGTILGGEGDAVDWDRVFALCEKTAGTEWFIVEQEGNLEGTSLDAAAECFANLRRMGKCG